MNNHITSLRFHLPRTNMKLVTSLAFLLTLANNKVHGGIIGGYGDTGQGQEGELQNGYNQGQNQEALKEDYSGQEQSLDYGGQQQPTDYDAIQQPVNYGGQEQQGYASEELASHEPQISNEAIERSQGVAEVGNSGQWQGGFQASEGFGEGHQDHSALASLPEQSGNYEAEGVGNHGLGDTGYSGQSQEHGNIGDLAAHGINLSGHEFEGQNDQPDLKPKVEVQHHHIPTKTIEHTKPVHIPVVKKIGVPVPHAVGVPIPQIIKVPVPQPYAVHVPVPHPISVPIYKLVPQEIEKKVPIVVEKLVPVYVDKPFKIEIEKHHLEYVDKPYAVHVPVYKHIYHHVAKHGSGGHSGGH